MTASLSVDDAAALVRSTWGLDAHVLERGSSEAQVFDVRAIDGTRTALKVLRAGEDRDFLRLQSEVAEHVASACPDLRTPRELGGTTGGTSLPDGRTAVLSTWVPGRVLGEVSHLGPHVVRSLGRVAGRVSAALAGFTPTGGAATAVHRVSDWDPQHARETLRRVEADLPAAQRALVVRALTVLDASFPVADALPRQLAHTDITDWNVLGSRRAADGSVTIDGVIDFGDLVHTWRLSEVAAPAHAAASRQLADPLGAVGDVVRGFTSVVPLTAAEVDDLWTVVLARAALCVALEAAEALHADDNRYLTDLVATDGAALGALLQVDARVAAAVLRDAAGHAAVPAPAVDGVPVLADTSGLEVLRRWGDPVDLPGEEDRVVDPVGTALSTEVAVPERTPVLSPVAGTVGAVEDDEVQILTATSVFTLGGVRPRLPAGRTVAAGDVVGVVREDRLRVHVGSAVGLPQTCRARDLPALAALCPDPAELLGLPARGNRTAPGTSRGRYVAAAQELYYDQPATIVRGRGQWLWDDSGRRLLDVVNNVAAVGHAHPRVTAAAVDQFQRHNTNSRFLYDAMDEYAELLATVLPEELRCLFFVNSGSEAVDLALQLARAHTGRRPVVALENAYHGWTTGTWELATMPGDRPDWRSTLSPDVWIAEAPDAFHGAHGDDLPAYLASLTDQLTDLAARGGPAAFVCEPLLGSQGGVEPVPGYLRSAYEMVRAAGAVTIADEIQVGFARTGATFWAFEAEGIVPDVLVAAKAVGNGHPLGFVACRPEIAESFAAQRSFFSSPGGGPVSCRIGTAVLRAVIDEGLQQNAHTVGARLSERLGELARTSPVVGAVHGRGLYRGVELVSGDGSRNPMAPGAARSIAERMRELGVITQPTGIDGNVLKFKPPLCIEEVDADFFADQLERALAEHQEIPCR